MDIPFFLFSVETLAHSDNILENHYLAHFTGWCQKDWTMLKLNCFSFKMVVA